MANSAGKTLTTAELNRVSGSLANDFLKLLHRAREHKLLLDQYSSAALVAMPSGGAPAGFAAGDADNIKSCAADLVQLADIAEGAATLAVAKDFRAFAKTLAGFSSLE